MMNPRMNSVVSLIDFYDYFLSERCRRPYNRCLDNSLSTRDRALSENNLRRGFIEFQRRMDQFECRITNLGNEQAIARCQAEVNEAAKAALDEIDRLDLIVQIRYKQSIRECRKQAAECEDELQLSRDFETPVVIEVNCIEGNNKPCFKPVAEFCTQISDPCDECSRTLCGDDAWSFESDIPLEVTLVAATEPKKDARVLSTSFKDGKQIVLLIPKQIRLKRMEKLYLGFSSSEKPSGSVKVLIYRS